ncbi:hypothetical protein [Nocardioides soli]|uniref:Uncharacterized protein n=1 Tax=Nocardioides soli TaxID=1036020 RepID=A0A7W4W1F3_9ACTN|nr:hypothetical protein [Nocardioides soli]MBB3045640.1 hypothetical protein [Nocardioides soli]
MDITSLQPDEETQRILGHILAEFAPDDPERPWKKGELRSPVQEGDFPVPELARAALVWAGFVNQRGWDEKTAWRVGGRFRDTNVSFASTKFGLRVMVETDRQLTPTENQPFTPPPGVIASKRVDLSSDPDLAALVADFTTAVRKAAQVFGSRVLNDLVQSQVESGNVTLVNQNGRLRGAYNFFRWQGQALIDGHGDADIRQEMIDITIRAAGGDPEDNHYFLPFFNPVNVGYCLTAMASAYFSWLEHVLVLALPFTPHWDPVEKPVTKAIGDPWSDKWRYVLRDAMAAPNGDAKKTFDLLSDAAEQFRNLDAHGGFGKKEQSLLVHSPMGAIPARLAEGASAIKATVISEAPSTFPEACEVFDAVDKFLRTGPLSDAFVWIEGGLQVAFHAEHRERMREAIAQGSEAFLEEVERFAELEDRINNFEY